MAVLYELRKRGNKDIGFPVLVSHMEGPNSSEIILEALGPNIRTLLGQCPNGSFSNLTCYKLVSELIIRLRTLHQIGFVHNDVKLENIVIGHQDTHRIYLIDFGLAARYMNDENQHVAKINKGKFAGNFLFASMGQCRGFQTSRRDDIESTFFILIYLLNSNKLPWSDFSKRYKNQKLGLIDILKKKTQKKYMRQLFQSCPFDLQQCLMETLSIEFDQEPPYDRILKCLDDCFQMELKKSRQYSASPSSIYQNESKLYTYEWNRTFANRLR